MAVRILPQPEDGLGRVETGAVQFGDDWPGLFVRGDVALYLAACIKEVLAALPEDAADAKLYGHALDGIAKVIHRDVLVRPPAPPQVEASPPASAPSKSSDRRQGSSSKKARARSRRRS